jgi:hypothetical protein
MDDPNLAVALVFGVDDVMVGAVAFAAASAAGTLATGLFTALRRKSPRTIEVKLPDGTAVTVSETMTPREKTARLGEIRAALDTFEHDPPTQRQHPVPAAGP